MRALLLLAPVFCAVAAAQSTGGARAAQPLATGGAVNFGACKQLLFACTENGLLYQIDGYDSAPTETFLWDLTPNGGRIMDIAYDRTTDLLYGIGIDGVWRSDLFGNVTFVGQTTPAFINSLDVNSTGVAYARSGQYLVTIDLVTLQVTQIGASGSVSGGDVAVDEVGNVWGSTSTGDIDVMDPLTGQGTLIGNTGIVGLYGIELDCDGTLYAFSANGVLFELDRADASRTALGAVNIPEGIWGMAFFEPVDQPIGGQVCAGVVNSTGVAGELLAFGSTVAADNALLLTATQLPPDLFAYMIASQSQGFVANPGGSQGNLCLANPIARYNAAVGPATGGQYSLAIDTTLVPLPPTFAYVIQPGESWTFQCWYRDLNPGNTSNFTSALEIVFQ